MIKYSRAYRLFHFQNERYFYSTTLIKKRLFCRDINRSLVITYFHFPLSTVDSTIDHRRYLDVYYFGVWVFHVWTRSVNNHIAIIYFLQTRSIPRQWPFGISTRMSCTGPPRLRMEYHMRGSPGTAKKGQGSS